MRVLVGMPSPDSWGGPIYCEPPFIRALRDTGIDADKEVYVYGEGATPVKTIDRILRVIDTSLRLRRRMRESEYDVVHLNTSFDEKCVIRDLVTLAAIKFANTPVHLKMHGSIASFLKTKSFFWKRMQRRVFDRVASIGVLSTEEHENFLAAGCPPEKLHRVTYVVDGSEFVHDPEFRQKHDVAADVPLLLFSGRFVPTKGLLDVIAACKIVADSGQNFILHCLGDGPQRVEAEDLVKQLGLEKHIRFTGYIPEQETAAFHVNSDIFVFPTYHDEGFPLVLLKSIAAGLPIITTRVRAAADYLTDQTNCLWTKPQNPEDLADQIIKLLANTTLRQQMSQNNRDLAKKFTPEAVVAEYIDLYRKISDVE